MSTYTPASSVGWLDLDAAASERVATLLRSLDEPATLDALGLGSVRDTFSNLLSPGTSTIQTRLRYFLFLPWIFGRLESQRVSPGEFARRLRDTEAQLIDCLRHIGPGQGVIGYTAGRDVQRLPSETYWGSLWSWGLRRFDLSMAEYAKRAAIFGRRRPDRDDDGNLTSSAIEMWAAVPEPPEGFLEADTSFDLRRSEAEFLADRIRERHPRSLLAALCNAPELAAGATFPWDIADDRLSERPREVLHHARCFSELTVGPQHVYNVLLARAARAELRWSTHDLEERQRARLDEWAQLVADRHDALSTWVDELSEFWTLVSPNGQVGARTQHFITAIVTRAVANPAGVADDPAVANLIRNREIQLKAKRARLAHRSALESWGGDAFGGQLTYRWEVTRSYLNDLAAGMEHES